MDPLAVLPLRRLVVYLDECSPKNFKSWLKLMKGESFLAKGGLR